MNSAIYRGLDSSKGVYRVAPMTLVVIHGTFAPDAPWTKLASDFHVMIQAELGDTPLNWKRYSWSGDNSHEAQEAGASSLASELKQLKASGKK